MRGYINPWPRGAKVPLMWIFVCVFVFVLVGCWCVIWLIWFVSGFYFGCLKSKTHFRENIMLWWYVGVLIGFSTYLQMCFTTLLKRSWYYSNMTLGYFHRGRLRLVSHRPAPPFSEIRFGILFTFLLFGVRSRDFGAERLAVGISYVQISVHDIFLKNRGC